MNIDLNLLDNFNRNNLSKEEMLKVESALLQNKVANASFSTLIQEYQTRSDIDELIGEDDEENTFFDEIEKKVEESCKKLKRPASIVANIKIQQSMNNMKVTTEEMAKVAARRNAISARYESEKTLVENLIASYKEAHPDCSEEEASEVVGKLMKGCEELTLKYNQAISEGFNAEEELTNLTKDMDVETRFNYLINALAAVEALNASNFASQKDVNEAVKKAIEEYAAATPNPTEEDCDTIQKLLVEAISNNTLVLSGMEKAQELLASAKDANTVIDFASGQYDDARTKAEMALAMWLEYEAGNIASIEPGATPESIGIGTATAVEEAKVVEDLATGRTTADIAIKCLKILGGVALILLLGYIGLTFAATIGGLAASALLSVFGTSTIACIATTTLSLSLVLGYAKLYLDGCETVFEGAGNAFDFVVEKLRESVFPKIREIGSKFITWIKEKLGGKQSTTETTVVMA